MGHEVVEQALAVEDIMEGAANGRLKEAFGTGTACVVSPVGQFTYKDRTVALGDGQMGILTTQLYNTLTGIQYGRLEDKYGWIERI
jgi:branched-chain amino acid aminotransferase